MPFGEAGHLSHLSDWSKALALCCWALHSLRYISFDDSALTNTTDNQSEMCTDFYLFLIHQSYTILQCPLRLEQATPRWESQHSNHSASSTCLKVTIGARTCAVHTLIAYTYSCMHECRATSFKAKRKLVVLHLMNDRMHAVDACIVVAARSKWMKKLIIHVCARS